VGSIDDTNLLSTNIREKCGEELEVSKLRKPRLIIRNIPQDITVEILEETILASWEFRGDYTSPKSRTEHETGGVHSQIEVQDKEGWNQQGNWGWPSDEKEVASD